MMLRLIGGATDGDCSRRASAASSAIRSPISERAHEDRLSPARSADWMQSSRTLPAPTRAQWIPRLRVAPYRRLGSSRIIARLSSPAARKTWSASQQIHSGDRSSSSCPWELRCSSPRRTNSSCGPRPPSTAARRQIPASRRIQCSSQIDTSPNRTLAHA